MPQTCPYCRETIQDSELAECPACRTPHHQDCWDENGGCTVFGCEHAPADDPKIEVSSGETAGVAVAPAYFIGHNGEQLGPFALDHIRQELHRGAFRRDDLAWTEGLPNWVPLAQVIDAPQVQSRAPAHLAGQASPSPDAGDPCAGRLRFGRGVYFLPLVATVIVIGLISGTHEMEGLSLVFFWCVWLGVGALRARDVGMSGWSVLLLFVPIANLFVGFRLLLAPRGYAITKQADTALRVMTWVFLGLLALFLVGVLINVATNH